MKKRIWYLCLFFWLSIASFYTLWQWKELNRFQKQAGLRFENNGITLEQKVSYEKKEENQRMEVTAWCKENQQNIQWKELDTSTSGTVVKVSGNMARVLPYSMKYGGFTFPEDTSGCVISSGLAFALFQTDEVVGSEISYGEKEWSIRGVLDTKEPMMAVYQQEELEMMPFVELYAKEGHPPAVNVGEIKGSLGLYQESYFFAGSFYCSLARLCMSLPFWLIFGYLCYRCWNWKSEGIPRVIVRLGLVFLFGLVIFLSISFTADFIPSQWSDFNFWTEKWKEITEGIRQKKQMPQLYWEQEVLKTVRNIAVGILAVLGGLMGIGAVMSDGSRGQSQKMWISPKKSLEKGERLWYSFKRQ